MNRHSHTVSLRPVLVHASLQSRLPADFSARIWLHSKTEPLFRTHRRPCQRDDDLLRASSPSYGLPCGALRSTNAMCTTDFCFPLLRLRVPVPRVLPASLRGLRLALGRRACTRDQETGEPGVSRRRIRFGGLLRVDARLASTGRFRSSRTSDTPVAARATAPCCRTMRTSLTAEAASFVPP
jgi:hypothetical protein